MSSLLLLLRLLVFHLDSTPLKRLVKIVLFCKSGPPIHGRVNEIGRRGITIDLLQKMRRRVHAAAGRYEVQQCSQSDDAHQKQGDRIGRQPNGDGRRGGRSKMTDQRGCCVLLVTSRGIDQQSIDARGGPGQQCPELEEAGEQQQPGGQPIRQSDAHG